MKKFLFVLTLILSFSFINVDAQTYRYVATEFAFRYVSNGYWTSWCEWQPSAVRITLDLDNDIIKVFSQTTQIYIVIKLDRRYTDDSGGKQVEFTVIDQDEDIGKVRLRIETNGNSQLYVDFADVSWVYSGLKRY